MFSLGKTSVTFDFSHLYHPIQHAVPLNDIHQCQDQLLEWNDRHVHITTLFDRRRTAQHQWICLVKGQTSLDIKGKMCYFPILAPTTAGIYGQIKDIQLDRNGVRLHWPVEKINGRRVIIPRFFRVGHLDESFYKSFDRIMDKCILCLSYCTKEVPQVYYYIIHINEPFGLHLPTNQLGQFTFGQERQQIVWYHHFCVLKQVAGIIHPDLYPLILSLLWRLYKEEVSFEHSDFKKFWWCYWDESHTIQSNELGRHMEIAMSRGSF